MKSDDHRADNLFLRLFAYTPRIGRLLLEDFCTEALAWCLRNCTPFRRTFLRSLNLKDPGEDPIGIATQVTYAFEEVDSEIDDGDVDAGRFDLVVYVASDGVLLIVETKVGSGFGVEQLRRYRDQLKRRQKKLGYAVGMLVTLTDRNEHPAGSDRHLTWAAVQPMLACHSVQSDSILGHGGRALRKFRGVSR